MNRTICAILLIFTLPMISQNSFEGVIKYKIEIETAKDSVELKQRLEDFYGESISMYYWKDGSFKINYNACENENYTFYSPATGNLTFHTNRQGGKHDSSMIKLHFLSKRKGESIEVLGKLCDCFEYKTEDPKRIEHTLTYCFSRETPQIDYRAFKLCKDFFLKEYYETAERPYLKYTDETKFKKTSWIATDIEVKQMEPY